MKITFRFTKKNVILAAVLWVLSFSMHWIVGISVFNGFMFGLLSLIGLSIEVSLNEKLNILWSVLVISTAAVISAYLVQYILLVSNLRDKISNEKMVLNLFCCVVVYLTVQMFTNHVARTCIISHLILLVLGFVNYFVYAFRGNELTFGDWRSLATGISVASNYQFRLDAQAVNAILLTLVCIIWVRKVKIRFQKKWLMRVICLSILILLAAYVARETRYTTTETWEQKGSYRNGFILNFTLSIRDSFVEKPEGYSNETVDAIEKGYKKAEKMSGKKPTVIAIMDESFADLAVMGELYTNQEVTPFISSLTENTVKGYALSPVFGAKTPNAEWEFLTGNSMAWLPSGSVPYQQYIKEENAYSLVDTMKNNGYTSVAMHPYYETGWSRDKVYPQMGFDETYFLDDFDQTSLMRKYVSDHTMFDKVISRYESKAKDENLFLFGITMQNHGGYTDIYDNFSSDIWSTNIGYFDVNQYLSLIHQTDKAVERLVTYFSQVEEPVVICFFGDHQPSLNTSFYYRLNGKGLSGLTTDELEELYQVPFFIWSNYESEASAGDNTSLNYLSTMMLEKAGIPLPSYNQFLKDLREVIPAMNARAYFSTEQGRFIHYPDATGEEAEWLDKYQIMQYNGLFGKKNQSQLFFER